MEAAREVRSGKFIVAVRDRGRGQSIGADLRCAERSALRGSRGNRDRSGFTRPIAARVLSKGNGYAVARDNRADRGG